VLQIVVSNKNEHGEPPTALVTLKAAHAAASEMRHPTRNVSFTAGGSGSKTLTVASSHGQDATARVAVPGANANATPSTLREL